MKCSLEDFKNLYYKIWQEPPSDVTLQHGEDADWTDMVKMARGLSKETLVKMAREQAVEDGPLIAHDLRSESVRTLMRFVPLVNFLEAIESTSRHQAFKADLGKIVACKIWPQVLWKMVKRCKELDLPGLASCSKEWAKWLTITPVKFHPEVEAMKTNEERKEAASQLLAAFSAVASFHPTAILSSPCFHKNSDSLELWHEDIGPKLEDTAKGNQWTSYFKRAFKEGLLAAEKKRKKENKRKN